VKILLGRINHFHLSDGMHPRDVFMPFELAMLSSMLKKNNQISIWDNDVLNWSQDNWRHRLSEGQFQVIVLKFNPDVADGLIKEIKKIKKCRKCIVILLDFQKNKWYERLMKESGVDYAIWGDPEEVLAKYILFKKKAKGFVWLNNKKNVVTTGPAEIGDIDRLPFYDHESFLSSKYKIVSKSVTVIEKLRWGFMLTSRGCPYRCNFCSPNIRNSFGSGYRSMSPGRILAELKYMVKRLGINAVSFEDDLFTLNKQRIQKMCRMIIKCNLRFSWVVSTRADCLDENLIKIMKRAGCGGVAIGVESGSQRIIKAMDKGESLETIRNSLILLKKAGIAVTTNVIIGYPGETIDDYVRTRNLLHETMPLFVHGHYLALYPGVKLYEKYSNWLLPHGHEFNHRKYNHLNLTKMDDKVCRSLIKRLYFDYYFSLNYLMTYLKFRWRYWWYDPVFELSFLFNTARYLLAFRN
jgi:anaerobic magnesium-protoporphyrin IX monomethyl ester cyclase